MPGTNPSANGCRGPMPTSATRAQRSGQNGGERLFDHCCDGCTRSTISRNISTSIRSALVPCGVRLTHVRARLPSYPRRGTTRSSCVEAREIRIALSIEGRPAWADLSGGTRSPSTRTRTPLSIADQTWTSVLRVFMVRNISEPGRCPGPARCGPRGLTLLRPGSDCCCRASDSRQLALFASLAASAT